MILPMAIAAARKMKMSPEKIDDTRLRGGLQPPGLVRLWVWAIKVTIGNGFTEVQETSKGFISQRKTKGLESDHRWQSAAC